MNYSGINIQVQIFRSLGFYGLILIMTVLVVGCTHTSDISQNPISPSIHTCSGVKGYSGGVYMQTSANYLKPVEDVKYIRTEHFGGVHPFRITVYIKKGHTCQDMNSLAISNGWDLVSWLPGMGVYSLDLHTKTSKEYDAAIDKLKISPIVEDFAPVGTNGLQ